MKTSIRHTLWFLLFLLVLEGGLFGLLIANQIPLHQIGGKVFYSFVFGGLFLSWPLFLFLIHKLKTLQTALTLMKVVRILGRMGIVVSTLLSIEVIFRLFPIVDSYDLNPGVRFFWPDRGVVLPNRYDHRGVAPILDFSPHVYRIAITGDSLTEGAGVQRNQIYSAVFERTINAWLQRQSLPKKVQVVNLGQCGLNASDSVDKFLEYAPGIKPQYLVFSYVLNDAEMHQDPVKMVATPKWMNKVHDYFLDELHSYAYYFFFKHFTFFKTPYRNLLDMTVAWHADESLGWKTTKEKISQLADYARQENIEVLAIVFPYFDYHPYPDELRRVSDKVISFLASLQFDVIDLLLIYHDINPDLRNLMFTRFDAHPNPMAHQALGDYLTEILQKQPAFKNFVSQ